MNKRLFLATASFYLALLAAASTAAAALPMPPRFETAEEPSATLAHYPLGVITKEAALIHHGKAHWTTKLPNGRQGWVYQYGSRETMPGMMRMMMVGMMGPGYGAGFCAPGRAGNASGDQSQGEQG